MKSRSWVQVMVAALLVLAAGAVLALAKTTQITVEKNGEEKLTVKTDGVMEELRLEDFADGEERSFGDGEHKITVRRNGDSLNVMMDGFPVGHHMPHHVDCDKRHVSVWCDTDEELLATGEKAYSFRIETDREDAVDVHQRIAIVTSTDGDEVLVETLDGDVHPILLEIADGEGDRLVQKVIRHHGCDRVQFVCEEDGSAITIPTDKATQETYLCPVCGREMQRQENQKQVHVMKIIGANDDEESRPRD